MNKWLAELEGKVDKEAMRAVARLRNRTNTVAILGGIAAGVVVAFVAVFWLGRVAC